MMENTLPGSLSTFPRRRCFLCSTWYVFSLDPFKHPASTFSRSRSAITRVTWARDLQGVTLLRVVIQTGRTHQIRVHLSAIGHPIVGDSLYGGVHRRVPHPLKAVTRLARPFLHAERLVITHPRTGERMEFMAPIPADLEAIAYELAPPEIRETVFARVSIAEETHHDLDEDEDEDEDA